MDFKKIEKLLDEYRSAVAQNVVASPERRYDTNAKEMHVREALEEAILETEESNND